MLSSPPLSGHGVGTGDRCAEEGETLSCPWEVLEEVVCRLLMEAGAHLNRLQDGKVFLKREQSGKDLDLRELALL